MSVELQIIPECYVDTTLVSTLLGGIGVNHQKSCNRVVSSMRDKYGDGFAVGIIDADKRRPGYLEEFDLMVESEHLHLYKHPLRHHYIITVSPAAEGFVLDAVKCSGLFMNNYHLPDNLAALKRITKHIVSSKDPRLVSLFRDLSVKGEVKLLKNILKYLQDARFDASAKHLLDLFRMG